MYGNVHILAGTLHDFSWFCSGLSNHLFCLVWNHSNLFPKSSPRIFLCETIPFLPKTLNLHVALVKLSDMPRLGWVLLLLCFLLQMETNYSQQVGFLFEDLPKIDPVFCFSPVVPVTP